MERSLCAQRLNINVMKKIFILTLCLVSVLFACNTMKNGSKKNGASKLDGTWELDYISGPRIAFDGLYPNKKPTLVVNTAEKRISGNSSCNNYNGPLVVDGHNISFKGPIASTKMACLNGGNGEAVYFKTLETVTSYDVVGDTTLNLIMGDIAVMRFKKK
jgi:heat shock protein HslJ